MEQGIRIRTLIMIWLILSGVSSIRAQSAGDIDTLSQWRVTAEYFDGYENVTYDFKYYISGTVTVDSLEYYKVYKSGISYVNPSNLYYFNHVYAGALREEGNKWYKPNELLYDFTMGIGDTVYPYTQGVIITVSDIDTIMIDGMPKKRFQLENAGFGGDEMYIIEDIGATAGLFELLVFFENYSYLHCYAIDYVPLWLAPDFSDCDLSVSITENSNNESISTYPNPFTTSTTIEYKLTEASYVQLTIYNAIGETIHVAVDRMMPQGKHSFMWTADRLPEGLYYAGLRSEEGVSVVKMVKQ